MTATIEKDALHVRVMAEIAVVGIKRCVYDAKQAAGRDEDVELQLTTKYGPDLEIVVLLGKIATLFNDADKLDLTIENYDTLNHYYEVGKNALLAAD